MRSPCWPSELASAGACCTVRNLEDCDQPRESEMSFLLTPKTLAMCSSASALPAPSRDGAITEIPTSPLFTYVIAFFGCSHLTPRAMRRVPSFVV
eukprot:scaffold169818_cov31-Tisochrysis_lutea.AAC.1